jgi:hypothetical protein
VFRHTFLLISWIVLQNSLLHIRQFIKMSANPVKRAAIVFLLLSSVYLCTVAAWASISLDELVAAATRSVAPVTLSPRQLHILVKVEDPDFFEHAGISVHKGQGFATITSAVARAVYLDGGDLTGFKGGMQSVYRKVFDCCKKIDIGRDVMALVLNARIAKARQLELYATNVYMGTSHGTQVKGLAEASSLYVGKPLNHLSDHEFIGLVAMIKAPNKYHPFTNPAVHADRVARIDALLAGSCQPSGWFDTSYDGCKTMDTSKVGHAPVTSSQ